MVRVHVVGTLPSHRSITLDGVSIDDLPLIVAAPAHPSLDGAVVRFADALRTETRWFGRRGVHASKPTPSLIRRLTANGPGLRLAAVHVGEIIGLVRIDLESPAGPELLVAVVEPWRRRGVALELVRAVVGRAGEAGMERLTMRTASRCADLRRLGRGVGFAAVDLGGGRVDLVRTHPPAARTG